MSQAVFPALESIGWSVFKRPTFSTRISQRQSGREVRAANYAYPLYEFELTYEILRADTVYQELQQLMGFFLQRQGQFDTFLFMDPTDNLVASQVIGVGDGTTTVFPLIRNLGGWVEPVGQAANQPTVTVGGVPSAAWGIEAPNLLVFSVPPALGAQVRVENLEFYFVCRFLDDVQEYENFSEALWQLRTCKFRSVKP